MVNFVSVIMPVYNGGEFLADAIESVLAQSYEAFELLIIDDGSTDGSLSIIKRYQDVDRRIKIVSRENRGLGSTLNELIELSSYELVARMDSDDICDRDRLMRQVGYMTAHPECSMVGGQIEFLVGDVVVRAPRMPACHDAIRAGLLEARFPICHPAVMFRKSMAHRIGLYKVSGAGEDLDFFLRMSEVGTVTNVAEKILSYRIQLTSLSVKKSGDLNKAYSCAVFNAKRRASGDGEVSLDEYELIWLKNNNWVRLSYKIRNISEIFYRKSIIGRAKSDHGWMLWLAFAAVLRPVTSFRRLYVLVVGL